MKGEVTDGEEGEAMSFGFRVGRQGGGTFPEECQATAAWLGLEPEWLTQTIDVFCQLVYIPNDIR